MLHQEKDKNNRSESNTMTRTRWHKPERKTQTEDNEAKDTGRQGLYVHWSRGAQVRAIKGKADNETQVTAIKKRSQEAKLH